MALSVARAADQRSRRGRIGVGIPDGGRSPDKVDLVTARVARRRLLSWARHHGRHFFWRRQTDAFTTAVVEILLKQTRAENAEARIARFVARHPTPHTLARRSLKALEDELKPLGLHRQRARHLRDLGAALTSGSEITRNAAELRKLPGVGSYVAEAIQSFVFGMPTVVIDVNTARIVQRVFGIDVTRGELRRHRGIRYKAALLVGAGPARHLNWAMLDLGAAVCRPVPKCGACPLGDICAFGLSRRQTAERND